MKKANVFSRIRTMGWMLAVAGFMWGCITDMDGITCDVDADCAKGVCQYGVCVGTTTPTDTDTDTGTGTETGDTDGTESPTDAQPTALTAVDLLFVVDNSASMTQEQELLAMAVPALTNLLAQGINGVPLDVRVAMVTTDMGLSYTGGSYDNGPWQIDLRCSGYGNNGEFLANTQVCPAALDFLAAPGYLTPVNQVTGQPDFNGFTTASACVLQNVGTSGCNFEKQLAAVPAAMGNYNQSTFLRADALTVVIVISDEEDCSVASADWYEVSELGTAATNTACGKHPDMLEDVQTFRQTMINIKTAATGADATASLMFAAITGVPVGSVCEGRGDQIGNCLDVAPGVNGTGTMGNPAIVERAVGMSGEAVQTYFEYACIRYAEGTSEETGDFPITAAYPATRIVKMAQLFGEMGYIYSICNADWSPVMVQVAQAVLQRMSPDTN